MAELIVIMLGSLFRMLLLGLFGALIERNVWTADQVGQLAVGLAGFVSVAGWALWKRYHDRLRFLTALESPAGVSEADIKAKVSEGMGAKLLTLILAFAIGALSLAGCAAKTPLAKHQVAALTAGKAALGIDQAEYDSYGAGAYGAAEHARLGVPIRSLLHTVRGYERAVAAWTGDPYAAPDAVAKAKAAVAASIYDLEKALAPVKGADKIRAAIRALKTALGVPLSPADSLPAPTHAALPILGLLGLILQVYRDREKDGTTGHFIMEMLAALKRSGVSQAELAAVDAELTAAIDRREHDAAPGA